MKIKCNHQWVKALLPVIIFCSLLLTPGKIYAQLQDTVLRKDAYLFMEKVFQKGAGVDEGIIAEMPTRAGSVTIAMYEYAPLANDFKGALLYKVSSNVTTQNFTGEPFTIMHNDMGPLAPYMLGDWQSNNAKVTMLALLSKANAANHTLHPLFYDFQHVMLEVTIQKAALLSVKFPGLPPMDKGFFSDRFTKVIDAIKNPLQYPDYTIVAAHRGYWKDVPENSLSAYDLTVESGADMVELDTRLTKDDTLVAFHDECLDRITTGTGKLRDKTWDEVKNLQLKDRFGNITDEHMVSIRQALLYLKGNALVNLDLKERITKNADKTVTDLLTPTFKAALRIAKETGTLNQLVIKGKFTAGDLQEILDDVGITLADFMYTPVAFGWDTPNLNKYVKDWLQEAIQGIELTYKVAYDPILNYMPVAVNKNIRTGIYTIWPEDANGVMAEDNVNDTTNYCQFNYREYNFLQESGNGIIPAYSGIADGGSSGPPIQPDDSNYGGGSSDYINYKGPKKMSRPEMSNDGRGDWDWVLNQGADFIITDRPVLLLQYLEAQGKRKLEKPVITEVTLPDCPVIEDGIGGKRTFTSVRGMVRKISDYNLVDFFTPDTRQIGIDTNLVIDTLKQFSNGKTREWVKNYIKQNRTCTCNDLFKDSAQIAPIRRFPLYSLPDWSKKYPGYDLYINANWFDVKQPWPLNEPKQRKTLPKAMYKEPCTNIFGWLKGMVGPGQATGTPLTQNDSLQPGSQDYDALVITANHQVKMLSKDSAKIVLGKRSDSSKLYTSGYIIARNGQPVPYTELPNGINKTEPKKRSLIGINGKEIYIAEFQSPMLKPYQAADLMIKYFNCKDVFNFDAGGSSTMLSSRGQFPAIDIATGPYITSGSAPEDKNPQETRVYRPIPAFFAIRVKQPVKL